MRSLPFPVMATLVQSLHYFPLFARKPEHTQSIGSWSSFEAELHRRIKTEVQRFNFAVSRGKKRNKKQRENAFRQYF
jgi:hypothetical protein